MFFPNKGMLFEWNSTNLKKEKEGTLPQRHIDLSENASHYYSLTDAFHGKSKKKGPEKAFRDLKFTDLTVNTSICEQTNAQMSKDR